MKMLCPHCGTSFKVQESETVHHEKAKEYQEYEETVAGYEIESFVCPECSDMIVILRYGRLVPLGAHSYHMIKQEILTEKPFFQKLLIWTYRIMFQKSIERITERRALFFP